MYFGKLVFESDEQEFSLKGVESKKTSRPSDVGARYIRMYPICRTILNFVQPHGNYVCIFNNRTIESNPGLCLGLEPRPLP